MPEELRTTLPTRQEIEERMAEIVDYHLRQMERDLRLHIRAYNRRFAGRPSPALQRAAAVGAKVDAGNSKRYGDGSR